MPNWTEEELQEMGRSMRIKIKLDLMAKKWITNRINYPILIYPEQPAQEELKRILKVLSEI